ncbi:hypothetical protein [Nevskia soli]|uniref:hypothetical protein n=1 Tax=Nevskia soli TaxID=418856 RepID=UPI0015D761A3|nr:hypothetical protein [Nevskia soli]
MNNLFSKVGVILFLAITLSASASAQTDPSLNNLITRLDQVEAENRKLVDEIRALREELANYAGATPDAQPVQQQEERLAVQESRTAELAQTKVEASQKMPISLTGMLLFNAFTNGRNAGGQEDPLTAGYTGSAVSGASVQQTILGLKFDGPSLPGDGKASGSIYMDFFQDSAYGYNSAFHIRTAKVDLTWGDTTVTVGRDKPIISPRDPDSLAQVGVPPLSASGNLWDWQPQARIEHRFRFDEDNFGVIAQAGVYETAEGDASNPPSVLYGLEQARPGYETRVELYKQWGKRRIEIAPGYHASDTHVLDTTVPSRIWSLDWLVRPIQEVEITGAAFDGRNTAPLGSLGQGFTLLPSGAIADVRAVGGWTQVAFFPTSRLSFHLYGGEENDRAADLLTGGIARNVTYAGNVMYRLAPNIISAFELSQTRTTYLSQGTRLNNHYDLALGYLF